jgi:hypothetical protein
LEAIQEKEEKSFSSFGKIHTLLFSKTPEKLFHFSESDAVFCFVVFKLIIIIKERVVRTTFR